jgi:hypothetical protein
MYEKHKLTLMRKFHMQNINQRAYPTFWGKLWHIENQYH